MFDSHVVSVLMCCVGVCSSSKLLTYEGSVLHWCHQETQTDIHMNDIIYRYICKKTSFGICAGAFTQNVVLLWLVMVCVHIVFEAACHACGSDRCVAFSESIMFASRVVSVLMCSVGVCSSP